MIAWNAHPASGSSTLTFDLTTGNEIQLDDLFEPESRYLDTLSRYCIANLLLQGATNDFSLTEGASPTYSNFEHFTLDEEYLTIIFDVYQVDSYGNAPGGYTVQIPYAALKNVLRKNGPIDSLLR